MYRGKTKLLVAIVALFAMMSVAVVSPALNNDSSAATDMSGTQLSVIYEESKPIELNAGSSTSFTFRIYSNYTVNKIIFVSATNNGNHIDISVTPGDLEIKPHEYASVTLSVVAGKYTSQGNYMAAVSFHVRDGSNPASEESGTQEFSLVVDSDLSSGSQYNKFMGIWANEMPEPFNTAWFSALITGLIWILIGTIARLIAVPVIMRIIMKKDDPDYESMRRTLAKMCYIIVVLNAIGKSVRVLGLEEQVVDTVNILFYVCYILVGAIIVWRLYMLVINTLVKRIGARDFVPGGSRSDFESLRPLLMYIGEIVISIATIGAIMSLLGFNMTAIITSAGIVSLGITLGAQNVLGQFFSGLVLLATRPFKKGDMITINGSSVTYRVRKVNIMQTELENWDNTDITLVPNSTLTSGIVKNITRDTLKCKIHVFISVGYGNDLAFVRATMLEVANENARVIQDGSVPKPSTRVTDFEDSNIQLRLSVYVDDFNDSGVIGGELRQAMYNRFMEKGISIDYTNIVLRPLEDGPAKNSE